MSFLGGNRAPRFLRANQIAALYEVHVLRCGPSQPILLQSAADSPPNNCHYGEKDLFRLAGILSERIILNHSFQDGNKGAAFLAADMFLKVNGFKLQKGQFVQHDEEVNEAMKNALLCVASNQWSADELAEHFRSVAKEMGQ
jgi:death-on-curing family protein